MEYNFENVMSPFQTRKWGRTCHNWPNVLIGRKTPELDAAAKLQQSFTCTVGW